jgi:hypothetical protein
LGRRPRVQLRLKIDLPRPARLYKTLRALTEFLHNSGNLRVEDLHPVNIQQNFFPGVHTKMRGRVRALLCAVPVLFALALFTTACGSSSSNGTKIRLVNAMPDETSLDLLVDTKSVATGATYGNATSYVGIASGSRQLEIEPTGTSTILITRTDTIPSGSTLTLLSLNFGSITPSSALLTDDNSAPASGDFKLRIVNASPGMGTQDVYIVPDGTDIGSVNPPTFPSMAFGDVSTYSSLAAGDYHVVFAIPGQKFITLDSGKLTYAAGQIRTGLGLNNLVTAFQYNQLSDVN